MRLLIICALIAVFALAASPTMARDCNRTEQLGCLEIDILNFRYSPPVADLAVADQGQSMYYRYKDGGAGSAGRNCYWIYFWNAREVSANDMSEYHIVGRDGRNPHRKNVTEVDPTSGPSFNTVYDIGDPERAFRVCGDAAVMAFQFPYERRSSTMGTSTGSPRSSFDAFTTGGRAEISARPTNLSA
jgi:hypothetical protein